MQARASVRRLRAADKSIIQAIFLQTGRFRSLILTAGTPA